MTLNARSGAACFAMGDRIPSVRQTSQHHKLSMTTVIHAYLLLESKGIIESRPQSGYFVRLMPVSAGNKANELLSSKPIAVSAQVDVARSCCATLRSIGTESAVPLDSLTPDPKLFPLERINRYAYGIARRKTQWGVAAETPAGESAIDTTNRAPVPGERRDGGSQRDCRDARRNRGHQSVPAGRREAR